MGITTYRPTKGQTPIKLITVSLVEMRSTGKERHYRGTLLKVDHFNDSVTHDDRSTTNTGRGNLAL